MIFTNWCSELPHNASILKNSYHYLLVTVGQEFREGEGTAGVVCLCSMMSEVSARRPKTWGLESSEGLIEGGVSALMVGYSRGWQGEALCFLSMWSVCIWAFPQDC